MKIPFEVVGGRRFALVCIVYAGSSALLWTGKLTPESYSSILEWSVAAYIAGNVAQRHVEARAPS